jgi:dTMP kinase
MNQAKFITFEGGDGCGKSTQRDLTVAALQAQGIDVLQTFEPGDSGLGKEIRRLLLSGEYVPVPAAELLLFLADRAQHVEQVIKPALAAGQWVVCDRYSDSTLAYQLAGRKLKDNQVLREMLHWAEQGLQPDMTFWLDLPVKDAALRMLQRQAQGEKSNRLDDEKQAFHEAVYHAFETIQQDNPQRIQRIHAKQTIALVQQEIQQKLSLLYRG